MSEISKNQGRKATAKEKIVHEIGEYTTVFLFVAPFLLALAAYRIFLQGERENPYLEFGMALVSALVLSKIILIGDLLKLGSRIGNRPLFIVTICKSALFGVYYLLFRLLEAGVRGLFHRESFLHAVREQIVHTDGLAIPLLFVFFAFIPFFALRETQHVIGEERFRHLFFGTRGGSLPAGSQETSLRPGPAR